MNSEILLGSERAVDPGFGNKGSVEKAALTSEAVVFSAAAENLTQLSKENEERFNLKPRVSLLQEYENSDLVSSLFIVPTNSQIPQTLDEKKLTEEEKGLNDFIKSNDEMLTEIEKKNPNAYNSGMLIYKLIAGEITQEEYDEQIKEFTPPAKTASEPVERLSRPARSIKALVHSKSFIDYLYL